MLQRARLATMVGLIVVAVLCFPYKMTADALFGQGVPYANICSGVQSAAAVIASQSHPQEVIAVGYDACPFSFHYYYEYSDYNQGFRHSESRAVRYAYRKNSQLPPLQSALRQRAVIWVVSQDISAEETIAGLKQHGYSVQRSYTLDDIRVQRLEPPRQP
jgi:hypothetical protein